MILEGRPLAPEIVSVFLQPACSASVADRLSSMAESIEDEYPPPLTPDQTEYLLANIKDWSILNGLAVRPSPSFVSKDVDPSGSLAVTAPVTLFPSLFPRACFEEARAIQTIYNELYTSVSRDEDWLKEIVEE